MAKQTVTRGQGTKKTQQAILLGASALAIGAGLAAPKSAWAAACGSFQSTSTIGSVAHCTTFIWTGTVGTIINNGTLVGASTSSSGTLNTGLSITGGKTLTGLFNNNIIGGTGTAGGFAGVIITGTPTFTTTAGTISYGISAYTTVGTINNAATGTILSDGFGGALKIQNGVKIGGFNNDGTILANGNSAVNLTGGSIGTLTNNGYIYSSGGGAVDVDVIVTISTIGTLINTGIFKGNAASTGALNVFGVVGSVNNSGTIVNLAGPGVQVKNYGGYGPTATFHSHVGQDGTISALTNSGTISGTTGTIFRTVNGTATPYAVLEAGVSIGPGGTIGVLTNSAGGTLTGNPVGTYTIQNPTITTIQSLLTLVGGGGVYVGATSGNASVTHNGYLGTLNNAGVIVGLYSAGSIGTIVNTGTIQGNVTINSMVTLMGGTAGTIGTFGPSGTLANTLQGTAGISIAGGSLYINDAIRVGSNTLSNVGGDLTIAAGKILSGNYYQTLANSTLTTSGLTVTGRMTLARGTIVPSFSSTGNFIVGTAGAVLYSSAIVNQSAVFAAVQKPTGANFSNITNGGTTLIYANPLSDYIGGAMGTLAVAQGGTLNGAGTISGTLVPTALYIASTGSLGTLSNSGVIRGDIINLSANSLSIKGGTLTTIGTLAGYGGTTGTITNTASNVVLTSGNLLLNDTVNVGVNTLSNLGASLTVTSGGTISVTGNYAQTAGTLVLNNSRLVVSGGASITGGTILASIDATQNYVVGDTATGGTVTLISAGAASAYTAAIRGTSPGINLGTIASGNDLVGAVRNDYIAGSYGTITNSGTLSSTTALYIAATGTLGALSNTGVIAGSIVNNSARDLVLQGASGASYGTFTGAGGSIGVLSNTLSNVTLTGNVLLNDAVSLGANTLVNAGGNLRLDSIINVTGNYSQTGGTLLERSAVGGGQLIVSGAAVVSGATYSVVGAPAGYHYLQGPAGGTPIISGGAGSSYTSITYDSGITGLTLGGYTQGTSLWGTILNDYVGDSLASISIASGTVLAAQAGVQTLIYISGAGTLGTLSNSGTVQGNINNTGSADLNIRGGSGATIGTLTGFGGTLGTITNTHSNVVVSGGNVYLADQVNVGSGLLYNTGATLSVAPGVTVTGNYLQNNANGTLVLGVGGPLVVSGGATISDGYVKVGSFDGLTNHVAGETTILVQAGAASSYTLVSSQSVPVVQSNVGGLGVIGTQVGNNLQAVVENDYFGTSTAAFTQAGTIVLGTNSQASAALYVAGTATIGTLTNTGVLNGEANLGNGIFMASAGTLAASIGTLVNSGTIAGRVGVANYNGVIGTIDNSGQILDSLPNSGIYNGNTITLVNNQAAGTIAGAYGIANSNLLGTILNAGLVAGSVTSGSTTAVGIANYGTLNTLTNSGRILATAAAIAVGLNNNGTLGALTNTSTGTIGAVGTIGGGTGNVIAGVANGGTIGTLSNSGLVTVTGRDTVTGFNVVAGVANLSGGTIGLLSNASTVTATGSITDFSGSRLAGVFNAGVVGTLSNTVGGMIGGQVYGIDNYTGGVLTQLSNAGTITSATRTALFNEGTIGTLSNSGTIQGQIALRLGSSGTIGTFTNSGTIAGSILNGASTALVIAGGAGTVVGVLTGASGGLGSAAKGTITSTGANLTLSSGNLLLNDDIDVTGRTLVSSGASLRLSNTVTVTGAYAQGATGTLVLGSGALLSVTGAATVTAGTVTSSGFNATGNYLAGGSNVTLVQGGAGSSYNTTVVAGGGITGLGLTGSVSGNNLLAVVGNDYVGGSQGSIVNSGLLSYSGANTGAVYVAGTGSLGTLVNSGTIAGSIAVELASGGTLGQVVNTGTVSGNLVNLSTNGLVLSGGTVAGTYTGGTITSTLANVTLASGAIVLGDAVNVGGNTLVNGGASVSLNTIISVTGNYSQSTGTLVLGASGELVVSGAATLTGGAVATTLSATGNYIAGQAGATLVAGGAGSNYTGVTVTSNGISGLAMGGTAVGTNLVAVSTNDYVGTLLPTLNNTLSIGGMQTALFVRSTGSIGTVTNSGTLAGVGAVTGYGASIAGTIGTLTNSGLISGNGTNGGYGLLNRGTIGTLINTVGGTFAGLAGTVGYGLINQSILNTVVNYGLMTGHDGGLQNMGTIQLLDNASGGTIRSNSASAQQGLRNDGTIVTLLNDGLIGNNYGLFQAAGTIQTLVNNGTIAANASGVYMSAAIGTISNSGTITASHKAIVDNSTLTALLNSGTLKGTQALAIGANGRVGTISNSGLIQGNIVNSGTVGLTIGGGANGTIGTLTGLTGQGLITNTLANLVFSSGDLLLNDNINVGSNTVVNGGASLSLATLTTVTGTYSQASGTLAVTPGTSQLMVNGVASITGGTVKANFTSAGTYLVGTATLVSSSGASSYAGAVVTANSVTGLVTGSSSISGNDLLLAIRNDYVGGGLATLANTGSIGGVQTAAYIAATGSVGTLSNSGTLAGTVNALAISAGGSLGTLVNTGALQGNITNASTNAFTILGGNGGTVGTLTGFSGSIGTLSSTGANVVLGGGNLLLNDQVNVGGNTLVNSGASVRLGTLLTVTGNYSQSAGTLDVGSNRLAVSNAASITGGTVVTTLSSSVNYIAGQVGSTLVAGGVGSNYTGVSVSAGTIFGLAVGGTTSGTNLVVVAQNDYIAGSLASLGNTGSIGGVLYAAYVTSTGTLGTLNNSGTLAGVGGSTTAAGVRNVGSIGTLSNSGVIRVTGAHFSDALYNSGTIGTLLNAAAGTIAATVSGAGVENTAFIGTLGNSGTIIGASYGLENIGTIATLNNAGTITGNTAISNAGSIGTLINSGRMGSNLGFYQHGAVIGTVINSGVMGGNGGVFASSGINTFINSGTVLGTSNSTGALSLAGSATIGTLINSGVINGNIINNGAGDLSIGGGTAGTVGTLTGGSITSTSHNVVFNTGALALGDAINVGANTVANTGANLALANSVSITGNYNQSAGTLAVSPGVSQLVVSGIASISGGKVSASLSSTGNYLAGGNYTLVQGGTGSSYTGATLTITGGVTGLSAGASVATIGGNVDLLMAFNNDYVGGTLATLNNTGTISANSGIYVTSTGSVGTLTNSGLLNGRYAFINQGSVGTLVNTGVIAAGSTGVQGQGNYGTVINSGTISGASVAVAFGGSVGTLVNSGLISGPVAIYDGSILGTLVNSGTIAGSIVNAGSGVLTILGGTGGTVGTLTGQSGSIGILSSSGANVVLASGALLLNDQVDLGGTNTLVNSGASVRLGSLISVTGRYSQTAGTLDVGSGRLVVSGAASITGGTVVATLSGTANYLAGQISSTTLVAGGVGSSYTGASVAAGGVTGLAVTGTTSGTNLVVAGLNDYIGATLGTLNNTGTISASNAVYVAATGSLGSLTNSGTLQGATAALNNLGSIGSILNGTLGTLGTLGNVGVMVGAVGVANSGSIGTLTSYGTITGTTGAAVDNQGFVYGLGNAGTMTGVTSGVNNTGGIAIFQNAGLVSGSIGLNNSGTLGVVGNIGFGPFVGSITGSATGIRNAGVIGTVMNQGVISGVTAIYNGASATLGTIANAGLIQGNIVNLSAGDLVIAGLAGTLAGGSITNTGSNVVFAGGSQVVGDAINVGSHTVVNSGATLSLLNDLSITGAFSQSTGTLGLGTNHLVVSGVAAITGGAITASVDATQNYVVGGSNGAILVQGGAGSSYTGVSLTSGVTGLTIAAGTQTIGSNVDLVVTAANDYIGGTLGSLGNSGTISGVVTAAYIATTGSLGTLANSGLLDGARYGIRNQGTVGLVDNSGTATGLVGLWNQGIIGTVINTGLLKDAPSAQAAGLNNAGSIGVLTNMGSISSVAYGLYNSGTIDSIGNSGVISATDTVTGRALRNAIGATIGALNNSGTIAGVTALYNQGSVGPIANSGVIAGNVMNSSANALVFTGGTGSTIGTLTGATGVGTLSSTLANVVLAGGNLWLNDQVDVGGTNTLVNSGASLRLTTVIGVNGTYTQSAGTLQVAYGSAQLAVSGAAVLTGGTIAATGVPGTINMLAGVGDTVALVAGGAGSSYTGLSYTSDVTGMEVTGSVGGNNLYLAGINDYVGGSIGTLSNSGTINANNAVYVAATGSLGSLTNSGTLQGATAALNNLGSINSILNGTLGTLGTLGNVGVMVGAVGVANSGSIGTLVSYGTITGTTGAAVDNQNVLFALGNAGTMTGVTSGVNNAGSIAVFQNAGLVSGSIGLNNSGTLGVVGNIGFGPFVGSIAGSATGIRNAGVIGTVMNQGVISGVTAIYNGASASLGTIANAGLIQGNIVNLSAGDLVIAGLAGTLAGGSITNTGSNVVFAGGSQVVGDAINVGSHTVVNSGATLSLASTVSITGNYAQATGTLALGSNHLAVSGVASISGGVVSTTFDTTTNYIVGSPTGVILVQAGAGSSYTGVDVLSGITGLTVGAGTQTIGSDVDLVLAAVNDYIGGTLATLNNTGTIAGVVTAAYIGTLGSLGTLANSGILDGDLYGIRNRGTIGLVANSGTATGRVGLWNQGTIGTVVNTGTLKDAPEVNAAGLNNQGTIGAVINQGGTISSVAYGLYNSGTIGSIDNSGLISATDTVSGRGLRNSGTIGALSNSGTIAGVTALYNQGSIGTIANSGTISGNVVNSSANALVFTGGTGSTIGTLTGQNGAIGTISSTLGNVELAGGNLLLNDQVNVGAATLVNSGANVLLTNAISVTGNYSQSAGTLAMGIGSGTAGELLVSGDAAFTGGTVAVTALSGSNLIAGQSYTIVEVGGTLTTSGLTAAATGFSATLGSGANGSATDLLLTLLSDYVGGNLSTLTNSGTINAATAVLITSAGSLGTLANSGAIIGNVINNSANDLVVVGGTGGAVGGFSGGTIRNSLSNLTFASGAVSLADAIDVTGHTVANTGASLTLASDVAVTGNYSQTAGTLSVAGHVLSVSGAAQVTGGVVNAGMVGTANYLVGDSVTLIRGGTGSTYTGSTVVSGLTGLDATGAASGSNLLAVAGNDYIGASLATLSVTGTLANNAGGATALYIAGTGTLGSLANSGLISGNITNVSARDLTIIGATGGGSGTVVGSFGGGTIRNTGANVVFASGAVALGDQIDVGGTHTVSNIGAALALTTDVGVTGTYAQSAGSLTVNGHVLTVSGPALVTGGTVSAGVSGVGNYFVGDSVTLIQGGAGSSYTGAVVTSGLTGLDAKGSVSGSNLLAAAGNDYIGASLATLNVTGTLANTAGGATALYIASTGTLGNLANSGTISGNVVNASTRDLTINGGGNGAVGRFTGGTITNTGSNVVFASGAISLGDALNVATHTVSNAGASIALASDVAVTGNFSQSSGTLTTGGHVLTVSGAANVTGGVVNAGVSAVGNYLAGDRVTLIQGGTGSNYAGATVTSGIAGLSATAVTSGSNLLAAAGNDYIGGSLDTLNNAGTVSSPTALYIASTGTLGTLANSGALAGNITNLSTGDLIINGGSLATPGTLTGYNGAIGTISNTGSNVRFTGGVQLLNDHINVGSHTVFNSGTTLLVNSAINITGGYSQSAGTLAIGVTTPTSYGNLAVSGAAAFTGGSVLLQGVGSGAGALQAGTYTIASGNGLSLSGVDFTATGYTVTSDLVTVGGTTQLVVKVAGKATNYTAVGNAQGGAAVGTGSALDQIAALASNSITTNPQVAAFTQQVLAPLATLTPAAKQVAVAQLSPSQLTPQLTATSVTPTTTAISQHQETVASLMDGSEKGAAAGSNGREGVIWGEVVGAGVLRGTTTEAAGYRASSSGVVLGADWFASDEVMAGLAFSWINSASVGQGVMAGSLTRVGSYQLTAYSVWRPDFADQKLSVEGQVGFGYNHFDQRRDIAFLGARANANYGGEQYLGKVTVGYDLPQQGAFTFTPQYSLRFVRLVNHAYQEHDAGPANLKVDVLGTNAVTQEVGLKVDTQWNTGVGLLSPDLRVAWVHDFKDGPIPTTGVLAGVAFASSTGRVNTDGLAVNLGATLQQSETFSLRLEYNGEYRHDYQSHGGVLRASWSF
ncbi:hypothetical protein UAJ10_24810 [Nitrospirillum sp. BR 11164]|uniref:hypothetical protein n=1 Tax=Nitrospirillum sp. BR 11164 TaxID=3104324 RepID=UPI002AFE3045|nr:hypothetical protein [Nitrospirillum sp. BR 11164]MEA1652220.1 hypothetical protein [Nitrospirillum sp. BR 11164]